MSSQVSQQPLREARLKWLGERRVECDQGSWIPTLLTDPVIQCRLPGHANMPFQVETTMVAWERCFQPCPVRHRTAGKIQQSLTQEIIEAGTCILDVMGGGGGGRCKARKRSWEGQDRTAEAILRSAHLSGLVTRTESP